MEDRTREHYRQLLDDHLYPTFGTTAVPAMAPTEVRTCRAALGK